MKLLRVLQEQGRRTASAARQPIKVDVRIIAATNRDLEKAVERRHASARTCIIASMSFRSSCRRCASAPMTFRDWCGRSSTEFSRLFGRTIESVSKGQHRTSCSAIVAGQRPRTAQPHRTGGVTAPAPLVVSLPPAGRAKSRGSDDARERSRSNTFQRPRGTGWRIRGAGGAAERLGLKPTTLESRMAKLGIARGRLLHS